MSLASIRRAYNVPAFKGARVKTLQRTGTITGSYGSHIRVRLDGENRAIACHPTCGIEYLTGEAGK